MELTREAKSLLSLQSTEVKTPCDSEIKWRLQQITRIPFESS